VATNSNLDVSVEVAEGLERKMTVRVPVDQIEKEVNARLLRVGKTAKIKGFRPGKVPQKVVRQRFGGEVRREVLSDVIRSTYSEAITQQALKPAGGPMIEPLPQDESHFRYRAIFEVYPDIEIASFEKLSIEKPAVEIQETDVDSMIEKLRVQRAEWKTVDRPAMDGDRIVVDFSGEIDGEAFEGGQGKEVAITVGEGQVIEDFEKALRGMSTDDSKDVKVKFPKSYPTASLAGKKAVFSVSVHRVEERVLPEVDEEFIKEFGVEDGTVESLRTEVRANMQRELSERLKVEIKNRVLDAFLAANAISVPRALVAEEADQLRADAMRRSGIDDPEQAPAIEPFLPLAEKRVALGLLVERVIAENDVQLDRDRVDQRIAELVEPYDQPEEAARVYRGNRELMSQLESTVLEDQVVDLLLEHARSKQKQLGFDDFMNAQP
jgi:trigger factor